jgi:hypothetical protein
MAGLTALGFDRRFALLRGWSSVMAGNITSWSKFHIIQFSVFGFPQ